MSHLEKLLGRFDSTLRKYNMVNYAKLQPPLSEEKTYEYLNKLNISDESFKSLFKWKNGFDFAKGENVGFQIFNFGALLSLEHLLKIENNESDIWDRSFIPLITDGGGDFILFNNTQGINYGKLHLYSVGMFFIDEPVGYYDSIRTMIETTIAAYEEGALLYDSAKQWLNQDVKAFRKIATKYNKHSEYWKL